MNFLHSHTSKLPPFQLPQNPVVTCNRKLMDKESFMKTLLVSRKHFMFIVVILLIGFAQGSYGQTITASVQQPLTESNLHGSVVTLTLSGGTYERSSWDIERALMVSGIDGVTFEQWEVERVSDTVVTIELEFNGNIDTDATLTFTVGAGAIAGYSGNALTATVPVTAVAESLEASPEFPLMETNLHGSVVTLMLNGRRFADREWDIEDAVSLSGIDGAAVSDRHLGVERVSNTEVKIRLTFNGDFDTDATLTLTVGADAIAGYNKAFTFQFPVTAVEESLDASTESSLTEATLDGSIITLTLTGRQFADEWYIGDAVSVSGIDGVTFDSFHDVDRISDTVVTVELEFAGNIDADATLTFTVGAGAIAGYNAQVLTAQVPVTAVEESLTASTEAPLTEATLDGSTITLTLTGRRFAGWTDIEDAVSVSGIDGVDIGWRDQDVVVQTVGSTVVRTVVSVSGTEVTMELEFSGNIDTDATLTLTVGVDAIVGGYDKSFTFQFPVTAIEESLDASTETPLTEATLDGSTITLTLSGRRFADGTREDAVSVSGIDGVTLFGTLWDVVERVSDTEIAVKLEFDGTDFDTDATLTFIVGADAIANHNQALTAQVPVTAIKQSNATVSIAPSPVVSTNVGEQLTISLDITNGTNVAGYQATVSFDHTALRFVEVTEGDYLPAAPFFLDWTSYREVRLVANTLAGAANGDGTLATLTFEVIDFKASTVTPSKVYLVDANGKRWEATTESGAVTIPPEPVEAISGDINRDGVVNIQDLVIVGARLGQRGQNSADLNGDGLVDIVDLGLVAGAFGEEAAAPSLYPQVLELFTAADVRQWLSQAQGLHLTDATFQRGIRFLAQLLTVLTPKETMLLPNYPNPFNPETWIPYRLAEDAFVTLTIYDQSGQIVRTLEVGHRVAAFYESRSKAIHWDGRNEIGEGVGSGVYFCHLSAGDYSATRKMLILK